VSDLASQGTWLVPSPEHKYCTRCGYIQDRHRLEVFCPDQTRDPREVEWEDMAATEPALVVEFDETSYTMRALKVGAKSTVTVERDGSLAITTRPVIWCPCGAEVEATESNFLDHLIWTGRQHLIVEHGWVEGRG
jgi:hypothetical protein